MAVVTKPYKGAPEFVGEIQGEYILAIQVGNDTGATGRTQMKRITLAQLQAYVNKGFGSAWRFRGAVSSLPNDPVTNDYFMAASTFMADGKTYTLYHLYGYNGTAWSDISGLLMQYIEKSAIADNLTTNDPTKVLSAKQGKILNDTLVADVADLQQQIDAISGGITPKGTVATMNDLPAAAGHTGWMYYVTSEGKYKVSDGSTWLDFGTYPIYYFALRSSFPASGALNSLYIAGDEQKIYWWTGTEYISDTAKMAEIDGYYQEMTVGDAEQLVATQVVEEQALYSFRTSGGSVDIGNRSYNKKIVGGTLEVNQLSNVEVSHSAWQGNFGTLSVSNNVLTEIPVKSNLGSAGIFNTKASISGHVLFVCAEVNPTFTCNTNIFGRAAVQTVGGTWTRREYVFRANGSVATIYSAIDLSWFDGDTALGTIQYRGINSIDLTAMFGATIADYVYALEAANRGAGVAWFRKYFPKTYYAYNAGTPMPVNVAAHKMVGFNQWNELWKVGNLVNGAEENPPSKYRLISSDFSPCLPNTVYHYHCGIACGCTVYVYDANKNYLGYDYDDIYSDANFTTRDGAYYFKIQMYGDYGTTSSITYHNDICINLSWSGTRNGEYEPYEEHSYPYDSSVELNGIPKIDADGNLYYDGDEYENDGTVTQKYATYVVTNSTAFTVEFYNETIVEAYIFMNPSKKNGSYNVYCNLYPTSGNVLAINTVAGRDSNGAISVTLPVSVGTTASDIASFLASRKCIFVYEKTTPTTVEATPYNEVQFVNDWGTEQFIDARVEADTSDVEIPVYAFTDYPQNLRDKLQHLPMTSENGDGVYAIKQTGKQMELEELSDAVNEVGKEITVGGAEQLVATVYEEDNVPYNFRTSGGSKDIGDRETDEIVGGTLGVNQLIKKSDFKPSGSSQGITFTNNGDGSFTLSGSNTGSDIAYIYFWAPGAGYGVKMQANRKYLFNCYSSNSNIASVFRSTYTMNGATGYGFAEGVYTNLTELFQLWLRVPAGMDVTGRVTVQVHDLTAMFGSTIADYIYSLEQAHTGDGVAWFRRYFPKPYYAYNAGSLESVKVASHDMTGFNQWDEQWEQGYYDPNTGVKTADNQKIRCKNPIRVFSNTTYYFKVGASGIGLIGYWDGQGNYLGYKQYNELVADNWLFTTPANCTDITFYTYDATYHNDICVNLSWSGAHNGEYAPFEKHSYLLDSSTEFRGIPKLDADGNLYYDGDIYKSSGEVTRKYGITDLGSHAWSRRADGLLYTSTPVVTDAKNGSSNVFCLKYSAPRVGYTGTSTEEGCISTGSNGYIYVKDNNYSDASTFKTAMNGVYLVYELVALTTEQVAPFTNPQIVNDWGTEEYVDAGVADGTRDFAIPVGHNTKYLANLRDKVQHLPNTADGDGDYVVQQEGRQMRLKSVSNYFPQMAVGTADNLKGKGTVGADFTFRKTGGSADIGSGSARLDKILGNTLMFNQLSKSTNQSVIAQDANGVYTFVNQSGNIWGAYFSSGFVDSYGKLKDTSHKYLVDYHYISGTIGSHVAYYGNGNNGAGYFALDSSDHSRIITGNDEYPYIKTNSTTTDYTNLKFYLNIFDLSQIFGAGNEPTIDEFKALFPLDYYGYTAGMPLNFTGNGLKTVGFNEFDGLCENGMWGETGKESASGRTRTTNLIRVFPNTKYYFCYPNSGSRTFLNFQYYDASGNALTNTSITKNRAFTTPPNACYVGIFTPPDNFGAFDICINLSWSGIRDGEYEPYWDSTLPLPITTVKGKASGSDESVVIFPDGMRSAEVAKDELTAKKGVVRIGVVDLGTLSYSCNGTLIYSTGLRGLAKKVTANNIKANASCSYPYINVTRNAVDTTDKSFCIDRDADINFRDSSAIDPNKTNAENASAFKAAKSGVFVYFELENPIEYTLDEELNLNYRVDDFGTEQLLPENESTPTTAPMVAQIAYAMNAVDTLRNLDKNFTNLATLDGLIAIINSKCGVNIVRGNFDSANNKYTFS